MIIYSYSIYPVRVAVEDIEVLHLQCVPNQVGEVYAIYLETCTERPPEFVDHPFCIGKLHAPVSNICGKELIIFIAEISSNSPQNLLSRSLLNSECLRSCFSVLIGRDFKTVSREEDLAVQSDSHALFHFAAWL